MMLLVKEGVFGYDKNQLIFNGIGFSLCEGEIMTVLGPNGVGKTTLLKCIVGLLKWHKGLTLLEEKPILSVPFTELWKKVSYVPQAKSFSMPYSVLDMVIMGRAPYIGVFSVPKAEDIEIARETMRSLGIGHLEKKSCSKISGGELQLALIARALVSDPRLVILDEPESHLDFRNQLVVLEKLRWISEEKGIACIINTHYPENALRISHRTLLLGKKGSFVFGQAHEIITEDHLREFFGVKVKIVSFGEGPQDYKTIFPMELTEKIIS